MKIRDAVLICFPLLLSGCSGCTQTVEEPENIFAFAGKTCWNLHQETFPSGPSKVWFGKDGTFVLEDHSVSGITEYTGSWSVSENVVTLEAEGKKIIFEVQEDSTIVLKTGLSGSASDDIFTDRALPQNQPETAVPTSTPESGNTGDTEGGGEVQEEDFAYYNASQTNPFGKSFVKLFNDGTFTFTEVAGMGAVEVKGLYGQSGNYLMFSNFEAVLYDDGGSLISNFEMEVYDEDTLILRKDLSESRWGDVFTISGEIPAGYTDPSPKEELKASAWKFTPEGSSSVPPGLEPNVFFDSDGTFVFTENCYSGMGQYRGWYEKTASGYLCHVTDASSMKGYAGDSVTLITFIIKDDHTLLLKTDLCMSRTDNEFILQ